MSVGRNDPCPCGSGIKYKKCCSGAEQAQAKPSNLFWHRLHTSRNELIPILLEHTVKFYGKDAINEAWSEFHDWNGEAFVPDSPELQIFMPWLFYNWTVDSFENGILETAPKNTPPAQSLLNSKKGNYLDPLQREYIEECLSAPFSYFEVVSCQPGEGYLLKDIFTAKVMDVTEKMGSETAGIGDIIFGKAVTVQDLTTMEATAPFLIPPAHKAPLLQLRKYIERNYKTITPEVLRDYDIEFIEQYQLFHDLLLNPQMPKFCNTDGDPLVPQRVFFEIASSQETFDLLKDLNFQETPETLLEGAEFDENRNLTKVKFAWLKKGNKKNKGWDNTILGHITINKTALTVEVNSEKRAKLFKKLFKERLGEKGRYKTTVIESLESKINSKPAQSIGTEKERREEQARLLATHPELLAKMEEMMAKHWENWIHEIVPALGNKTPLQAVKTKDGKEMTIALLTQFERETVNRPQAGVSVQTFKKIREQLGL